MIPTALANAPARALYTLFEFFAATIPNANTRDIYIRNVIRFFTWCEQRTSLRFEHFAPGGLKRTSSRDIANPNSTDPGRDQTLVAPGRAPQRSKAEDPGTVDQP